MAEILMQDLSLLSKYKVTSSDTDMHARLWIGSFVNYLIYSAISSADIMGFGFAGLKQQIS
jgi:medium-chain acyl-[acyl-carrier-protein] hydrolase